MGWPGPNQSPFFYYLVEDKTDMSEDYEKFHEIAPFTVNTDPSIMLNDEDCPWLRRKGTPAKKKFYTPKIPLWDLTGFTVITDTTHEIYLESPTLDKPEGIFLIVRVLMCFAIRNPEKYYVQKIFHALCRTSLAIF